MTKKFVYADIFANVINGTTIHDFSHHLVNNWAYNREHNRSCSGQTTDTNRLKIIVPGLLEHGTEHHIHCHTTLGDGHQAARPPFSESARGPKYTQSI